MVVDGCWGRIIGMATGRFPMAQQMAYTHDIYIALIGLNGLSKRRYEFRKERC